MSNYGLFIGGILCLAFSAFAQLPNPQLTPGATVKATKAQICTRGYATKTRQHFSAATRRRVFRLYGIPVNAKGYILDHKIPLEIGGANTLNNIQPQTKAAAHHKDLAENEARHLVCEVGSVPLEQAQKDFAADEFEKYISAKRTSK